MAENTWIEVVSLRFSALNASQAVLDIFGQVSHGSHASPKALKYAELYENTKIETDWSIYLYWENDKHPRKTILGLCIAERFRSLGVVNHSIWRKRLVRTTN